MENRHWPFILGGLVVLIAIAAGLFFLFSKHTTKSQPSQQEELKEVAPPEIAARPFFSFAPRADGKAIQISISGISTDYKIDYEITYKTGAGVDQGIGGPVALEAGQSLYSREHIFGTCSKNVCTYDKGVENGNWDATIQQKNEAYKLSGVWRLQTIANKSAKIGLDGKIELNFDAGTLTKSFFVITSENVSLPKKLPEGTKLIAGPFTFASSEQLSFKKPAKVTFSGASSNKSQILQLSSTGDWQTLETAFDQSTNSATASTTTAGTFILVEKI